MSKLGITRSTSTVRLCTDMGLAAQHESLQVALEEERTKPDSGMLVGNPEAKRLAAEITALEERMKASTVIVEHRALTRKRWVELMEAHPPREGNEQDAQFGVNVETFVDAALADAITGATGASDGEPVEGFTGADWHDTANDISNAQWQQFAFDLFRLNNGVTAGPTSRTASLVMRSSETTSEQPEA